MSSYTDLYTTQTMSVSGTRQRDVADTIRHLFPAANFMPMISSGSIDLPEGVKREKGLFGKRKVASPKYEGFVWTPPTQLFTAVSLSSTTLVLNSTTGLAAKQSLINTVNNTTCNIDSITNTTTCEVTTYGDTAFSLTANDEILALDMHMEEKSSTPPIFMKDPDNLVNYTYIFRHAVGISGSAEQQKHYGGDRYMHIKQENGAEAMRKASLNLLLDNGPASGELTASGLGHSFRSTIGLVNWAAHEYDFDGSFTYDKFMRIAPLQWGESVTSDQKKVLFCGHETWSRILAWQNSGQLVVQPGTYKTWGVESFNIITCRGKVDVVIIDAYNQGSYKKQALVCTPDMVDFIVYGDRDMKVRENIQNNSVDGREDEIYGEISMMSNDNGDSLCLYKNIY